MVVAVLLGVVGAAVPVGAAALQKQPKPTVTDFAATPTNLYDVGGTVSLSADVANGKTCVITSKPAVSGLPLKVACKTGSVLDNVAVPGDTGKKAIMYTFSLDVTGTRKVEATPITVTVGTTAPPFLTGAQSVVASGQSDCAVLLSGSVACWGYNANGELGIGSIDGPDGNNGYDMPQLVSGLSGVSEVTSGGPSNGLTDGGSYCALLTDGSVDCWGNNTFGDLGNGTTGGPDGVDGYDTPQPVSGLLGATAVVSDGLDGYCALLTTGGVDCWGSDEVGQLGNGSVSIPNGSGDSLGYDSPQTVEGVSSATALASDGYGYCAVLAGGGIVCWGSNENGDLGDGTVGGSDGQNGEDTAQTVIGITDAATVVGGPGGYCALLATGSVDCWGNNSDGELGVGAINGPDSCLTGTSCYDTPQMVADVGDATELTNIGIGYCVTRTGGAVDCWGYNEDGQLGNGTIGGPDGDYGYDVPQAVTSIPLVSGIASNGGGSDNCALLTTGGVDCWGVNMADTLGDGTVDGPDGKFGYDVPQGVIGITSASSVVGADGNGFCAVLVAGAIQCWGTTASASSETGRSADPTE